MKRKKELIVILSSLLVIVLSVSVAYFTTKILGTGKEISVESADLKVIFTSGSGTINGTNIEPGWASGENTFTVKNESNGTYKYNIIIKDLVNTFVTEGFLQYKITSTDGGYNMTDYADVPKSSTATDTVLAENISIAKGATHTYKIVINYNNSDNVDQSADMGKTLSGKIFITKASNPILASKILEDNPTIGTRTNFTTAFTTNTANTLYKATENGTDVYYFAGTENNSTGKCTYNGNGFKDPAGDFINISKEKCLSQMTLCVLSDYNRTDFPSEEFCTDTLGGQVITITNADWEETLNTAPSINNWVKFGKNSSNQDLYWRIIRTNADGSIRLLYHGTSTTATDAYIGTSKFNKESSDSMYVGYMYGTSGSQESNRTNTNNSTIKTVIDNWYARNMTSYTKYLSTTAVYCNDREVGSGTYSATESEFYYAAYTKLKTNKTPTYDCTNDNDKFTVDASTGNGKLTYPIALMTADEIAYAGGVFGKTAQMWYYTNSSLDSSTGITKWWSLSPYYWNGRDAYSLNVVGSVNPGFLNLSNVDNSDGVRPAVSLKSCVQWKSGDGSASSPYEIVENGGC